MPATEANLEIEQGTTFKQVFRWEDEPWLGVGIAAISSDAPGRITLKEAINLPDGWRGAIVDAVGPTKLNATSNPPKDGSGSKDMRRFKVIDATTLELDGISTAGMGKHKAGSGFFLWHPPVDMTGGSARMQIRTGYGGEVLESLTTDSGGGISIDNDNKFIQVELSDTATSALLQGGIYDLEFISADGSVTRLFFGTAIPSPEVTVPITP